MSDDTNIVTRLLTQADTARMDQVMARAKADEVEWLISYLDATAPLRKPDVQPGLAMVRRCLMWRLEDHQKAAGGAS